MSDEDQSDLDDSKRCGKCQHSVDVRGIEQIACLAHLAMRHPQNDGGCIEFEQKRHRPGVRLDG